MKKIVLILAILLLLTASACANGGRGNENVTDRVEIAIVGCEPHEKVDLKITEETAIAIADPIFLQRYGKEFVEKTIISVTESKDGSSFEVTRYEELMLGGDLTIIIRKSDAKVLRIEAGE